MLTTTRSIAGGGDDENGFVRSRTKEQCPTFTMASWTASEEATLLQEIKTPTTLQDIAVRHNRTVGAITSRLHYIISRSILADKACPIGDIKTFLKRKAHSEAQKPLTMDFKETFTREKLQGLAEERRLQQLAVFIDREAANGVLSNAIQGKTSFLYERSQTNPLGSWSSPLTDEELIAGLKVKFPGSQISAVEEWVDEPLKRPGAPLTRVLKKGIKIDWS
jgi:hypothetical protein